MEISLSEMLLLIWAVAATGLACYYFQQFQHAKFFATVLLNDSDVRNKILEAHEEWKTQREQSV